jgi:hypothetical protein
MISTLTWNSVLVLPFLLAFIGIPLYMTWKHLDRTPDHSAAHEYLAAKAEYLTARAGHRRAKAASAAAGPRPMTVHDVLRPLAPADATEDHDLVLAGRH